LVGFVYQNEAYSKLNERTKVGCGPTCPIITHDENIAFK
jgi:hypothetical protein